MQNTENIFQVFIKCFTFNHVNYIEDAMRGFVMQKTDFPYIAAIVDDASTDGEPDVIKRFLENEFDMTTSVRNETEDYVRVAAKHTTNVNCTFVVILLKYNHRSIKKAKFPYLKEWMNDAKYIALCEGDDYWTDPLKLQKQVDFLEEHEEFDMCCTRFQHYFQNEGRIGNFDLYNTIVPYDVEGFELKREHYLIDALPQPCTVMYRNGSMEDNTIVAKLKYRYDIPMYWFFMQKHRVWLMNKKTAMYRKHEGSITTQRWIGMLTILYEEYNEMFHYDHDKVLYAKCMQYWKLYVDECLRVENKKSLKWVLKVNKDLFLLHPTFQDWKSCIKHLSKALRHWYKVNYFRHQKK